MSDFLRIAIDLAKRSTNIRHKTGAVIVDDKQVVSTGWAHRTTAQGKW